jgi:hypothetical protein
VVRGQSCDDDDDNDDEIITTRRKTTTTTTTRVKPQPGLCSRVRLNPRISVCCGDVIYRVVDGKDTCCGALPYNPNKNECCPNRGTVRFIIVRKGFDCRRI